MRKNIVLVVTFLVGGTTIASADPPYLGSANIVTVQPVDNRKAGDDGPWDPRRHLLEVWGSDQNLARLFPPITEIEHPDCNGDGVEDVQDVHDWWATAEHGAMDEQGRVTGYIYRPDLDINGDGYADLIDIFLLTHLHAPAVGGLAFGNRVLRGNEQVVFFNGTVLVTMSSTGKQRPTITRYEPQFSTNERTRSPAEETESPRRNGQPECEAPAILGEWDEMISVHHEWEECKTFPGCGLPGTQIPYFTTVSVVEGFYNQIPMQSNCGLGDRYPLQWTATHTSGSDLSISAGLKISQCFNLGIEWGQESQTSFTVTGTYYWTSPRTRNDTFYLRFQKYTATYQSHPRIDVFVPTWESCELERSNETTTVFTLGQKTKRDTRPCPGWCFE